MKTQISPALRAAFRFFLENQNQYCTPPGQAACALSLARAERDAASLGWTYDWHHDPDAWEDALSDHRRYGEPLPTTCESVLLTDESGNILASLGGIFDADLYPNCRRAYEAELASEALATLEKSWVNPATAWDEATQTAAA